MTTSNSSPEVRGNASNIATVVGVKESLVTVDVRDTPVMKNEVGHVIVGQDLTERKKLETDLRERARCDGGQGDQARSCA